MTATELEGTALVAVARAIATIAHAGQVDKIGEPYIGHPARVAEAMVLKVGTTDTNRLSTHIALAWLHDVLEDSEITSQMLTDAGIPKSIVHDVVTLTRLPDDALETYYARIRNGSSRAWKVKRADIADNMDPQRLARIDDDATIVRLVRKYTKALALIDPNYVDDDGGLLDE